MSYQTIYDYLAAIQTETTLTADGEKIWEWCRSAQTQPLYATGSSFYTEQSNSKGIIIVDGGAGTIDHFTDDSGTQWVPPSTVTLTVTVSDEGQNPISGVRVRIEKSSDGSLISQGTTNASGIFTDSYTYTGDVNVTVKARLKGYKFYRTGTQILDSGLSAGVTLQYNKIVDMP